MQAKGTGWRGVGGRTASDLLSDEEAGIIFCACPLKAELNDPQLFLQPAAHDVVLSFCICQF